MENTQRNDFPNLSDLLLVFLHLFCLLHVCFELNMSRENCLIMDFDL